MPGVLRGRGPAGLSRQVLALVPKGRDGGARQRHFAHPPGMAPPAGRHSPESLWHAEGKQALRGWAADQGFMARVEAWTFDGRRRSDVEVRMPGGRRLAIELQLGCRRLPELRDRQRPSAGNFVIVNKLLRGPEIAAESTTGPAEPQPLSEAGQD
jgi:Competence protein CoiA-like family